MNSKSYFWNAHSVADQSDVKPNHKKNNRNSKSNYIQDLRFIQCRIFNIVKIPELALVFMVLSFNVTASNGSQFVVVSFGLTYTKTMRCFI